MAGLTKCVECGGQVSSSAVECPHCHRHPHFKTCSFCGKPLKTSQAVSLMHPACYEAYQNSKDLDKFSGPVCHSEFSHKSFEFAIIRGQELSYPASNSPCPKCGQPVEVVKCDQCGNGLIKGAGERVERRSQFSIYVHKFCVRFVENRVEPVNSKSSCLVLVIASMVFLLPLIILIKGALGL
jgi:hypothetical protein